VSLGHAERWLKWGIFEWAVTCALFLAGLRWGPQGVAVAWSVSFWILTLPSLWYAGRPVDFGVMRVVRAIWRYIAASLAAGVAAYAVLAHSVWLQSLDDVAGSLLRIVCVTVLFGALYLAAVIALHRGLKPLRTMITLIGELRGRRPAAVANSAENTSAVDAVPSA
jgi:PST family polysaccharide transporter